MSEPTFGVPLCDCLFSLSLSLSLSLPPSPPPPPPSLSLCHIHTQILSANNVGSFSVEVETDEVSVRTNFRDLENPGEAFCDAVLGWSWLKWFLLYFSLRNRRHTLVRPRLGIGRICAMPWLQGMAHILPIPRHGLTRVCLRFLQCLEMGLPCEWLFSAASNNVFRGFLL